MALPPTFFTANQNRIPELLQKALEFHKSANLSEAEKGYREVLTLDANHPDALHLLGMIGAATGHLDPAIQLVGRAAEVKPDEPLFLLTLSDLYIKSKRNEEAVAACRKALLLKPDFPEAVNHLGIALMGQKKIDEAIAVFRGGLHKSPQFPELHSNLSGALKQKGDLDGAVAEGQEAVRLKPDNAMFQFTLSEAYMLKRRHDLAMPHIQRTLALSPNFVPAHFSLGAAYVETRRFAEGIRVFEHLLTLEPRHAEAWFWIGVARWELGSRQGAKDAFERALSINPQSSQARFCLSNILLLEGDFERGWEEYEWRPLPKVQKPLWDGSPLHDKTILLYVEQGFGDIIQFIRYVPMVKALGAKIVLACHPNLFGVIGSVPSVDRIVEIVDEGVQYDVQCPLMSLPRIFRTRLDSIPAQVPYLFPDPEAVRKWSQKFVFPKDKFKVGLVWAGRPTHAADRYRSMKLAQLAPLAKARNAVFYSLQKGVEELKPGEAPPGMEIVDLAPDLVEYTDTAAAISHLDLLITVDTSAAHLGGAMGKSTWILIRSAIPDWRWLLDRSDTPWYPTARLFRQQVPGDWTPTVKVVADELGALAERW